MAQHKLHALRLYGQLSSLYRSSIDTKIFLSAVFSWKHRNSYTPFVWIFFMVLMASCVSLFLPATKEGAIFIVIFSELLFFLFAEMSLHRGISRFFKDDEIIANLLQHSWRLRRRIIRYAFFCRALEELPLLPTIQELDDCLQFIEANRSGRPPSWTSFFRHPITVAVIGIAIYTGNQSVILPAIQTDSRHAFLFSLSVVAILIMAGGWLYAMRYTTVQSDWELERAIRWYYIGREEQLEYPKN